MHKLLRQKHSDLSIKGRSKNCVAYELVRVTNVEVWNPQSDANSTAKRPLSQRDKRVPAAQRTVMCLKKHPCPINEAIIIQRPIARA